MEQNTNILSIEDQQQPNKKLPPDYRFWVETIFLFTVLVFSMVQLARNSSEQPVYFTIISGICGKITKLKIGKNKGGGTTTTTTTTPSFFDELDGRRPTRR